MYLDVKWNFFIQAIAKKNTFVSNKENTEYLFVTDTTFYIRATL